MLITGLSIGWDGVWSEGQLCGGLQQIITKHCVHFERLPVDLTQIQTDSKTGQEVGRADADLS